MQPSVSAPPVSAYSPSDLVDWLDSRRTSECATVPSFLSIPTASPGTSGTVYGVQARARSGQTFTQVRVRCNTIGNAVTGCRIGVYDSTGAKLTETADLVTSLVASSVLTASLGSSVTVTRGTILYLAIGTTWTTTAPAFNCYSASGLTGTLNALASQPIVRSQGSWTPGTLPVSLTGTGTAALLFWMELL